MRDEINQSHIVDHSTTADKAASPKGSIKWSYLEPTQDATPRDEIRPLTDADRRAKSYSTEPNSAYNPYQNIPLEGRYDETFRPRRRGLGSPNSDKYRQPIKSSLLDSVIEAKRPVWQEGKEKRVIEAN